VKCWKEFAEIVGVSGKQTLGAHGKGPDMHIGHRAFFSLIFSAFLNMPRPSLARRHGI
jgi:hypothetical protein